MYVADCSKCDEDIAKIKQNVAEIIFQFKEINDQLQVVVDNTADLCVQFFKAEHIFLGVYAKDQDEALRKANEFIGGFDEPCKMVMDNVIKIEASWNAFRKLSVEFLEKNDLTYRFKYFLTGCEAEESAIRSEISAFLKFIKNRYEKVLPLVKGCKDGLTVFAELKQRFDKDLSSIGRSGSEKDFCKTLKTINKFFAQLNKDHWIAHNKFVSIQFFGDEVTTQLSNLYLEYVFGCYNFK